jgi:plastocyanin
VAFQLILVSKHGIEMKNILFFLLLSSVLNSHALHASEIHGTVKSSSGKVENAVVFINGMEGKTFFPPEKPVVMNQAGLKFIPHVLPIIVGTTVNFPNTDVVLHNVFSPGYREKFNLGTYPKGSSKTKKFESPGIVLVLCNIHHEMSAFIVVVETPYFSVSDQNGKYTIDKLPPGKYELAVWHERMKPQAMMIETLNKGRIIVDFMLKK